MTKESDPVLRASPMALQMRRRIEVLSIKRRSVSYTDGIETTVETLSTLGASVQPMAQSEIDARDDTRHVKGGIKLFAIDGEIVTQTNSGMADLVEYPVGSNIWYEIQMQDFWPNHQEATALLIER